MNQGDLNLIVSNAAEVRKKVLAAKSRSRPNKGTVAACQRELIANAIRITEGMLERLRRL